MIQSEVKISAGANTLWKHIQSGNARVVRVLLEGGVDPNQAGSCDESPLVCAIQEKDEKITALLLEYGADACHRFEYDWTPLMVAVYRQCDRIVDMIQTHLEKKGVGQASLEADIRTASFLGAISRGEEALAFEFISSGASVHLCDHYGVGALLLAMHKNHFGLVSSLLNAGVDVSQENPYDGMTPLLYAAKSGSLSLVKRLLQKGVSCYDKNLEGENALVLAVVNHHNDIVSHLLHYGLDPDERIGKSAQTSLMHAAYVGNLEAVRLLIRFGANIHLADGGQMNALHYAVAHPKNQTIVRLLVSEGVDLEARADGCTPMMWCILNENFAVANTLLQCGARLNPVFEEASEQSFLSFLCNLGDQELPKVDYLLQNGAEFSENDLSMEDEFYFCSRLKAERSAERMGELLKRYGYSCRF